MAKKANNEKLTPRAMTFAEFERFTDFAEDLNEKHISVSKVGLNLAKWVAEEIYGIDVEKSELSAGTFIDLFTKTRQLTDKSEVDDLKNLNESGNGELKADPDSVTPVEKPQNN